MKALLPTRCLALFLAIGFIDLVVTAILHAQGRIVELNPIMRIFIEQSEWLFAFVKGFTLIAGWAALAWYCKTNKQFVRKVSLAGSAAYIGIWVIWFFASN